MVLPGRIELTTSPLPRECSTTELRQRTFERPCRGGMRAAKFDAESAPAKARRSLPQGALAAQARSKQGIACRTPTDPVPKWPVR